MITIRLLGGARKAVGKNSVDLDRPTASVAEILQFLISISTDARLLHPNNLIIAINGVDSTALQGQQAIAKRGDVVTIVTVVHGGVDYVLEGFVVSVIGIGKIAEDPGKLVDRLRSDNNAVSIQAIDADVIYGTEHLLGILRMTLEAEKRKIMIANKRETELLLRLACTSQISEALNRAGLKMDRPGCLVAFSQNKEALLRFSNKIKSEIEVDDSVLEPSMKKKMQLAELLDIKGKFDNTDFLQYLIERAAILVK